MTLYEALVALAGNSKHYIKLVNDDTSEGTKEELITFNAGGYESVEDDLRPRQVETIEVANYNTIEVTINNNTSPTPPVPTEVYAVGFMGNLGEGFMYPKGVIAGESMELPECEFVRIGYEFVGWGAQPYGEMVESPYTPEADTLLWAIWQPEEP